MNKSHPKVFISYSWDSEEHKNWVAKLVNRLRKNGVDATCDQFESQIRTVNLNQMMVSAFKDYDFVIIVLTESYAKKAEKGEGGVGFETMLSLPILKENPDNLILITREGYQNTFPSHLKGFYALDFSDDSKFDKKLDELVHRIFEVPKLEKEPLGKIPDFSKSNNSSSSITSDIDIDIANLKDITDEDKIKFIKSNFKKMCEKLKKLLEEVQSNNSNFTYSYDKVTEKKKEFKIFKNGNFKTGIKIWLNNNLGSSVENICISYGRITSNDNSMNEMIKVVNDKNNLKLKTTLSLYGIIETNDVNQIIKEIWENHILIHLK